MELLIRFKSTVLTKLWIPDFNKIIIEDSDKNAPLWLNGIKYSELLDRSIKNKDNITNFFSKFINSQKDNKSKIIQDLVRKSNYYISENITHQTSSSVNDILNDSNISEFDISFELSLTQSEKIQEDLVTSNNLNPANSVTDPANPLNSVTDPANPLNPLNSVTDPADPPNPLNSVTNPLNPLNPLNSVTDPANPLNPL